MATTKGVLLVGALTLGLPTTGCKRNQAVEADAPQGKEADASAPLAAVPQGSAAIAAPETAKLHIRASIEGLDDIFSAIFSLGERVDPDNPWDARSHIQAQLLTSGFGPAFFENIDLASLHALALAIPSDEDASGVSTLDIAGTIAVIDGRRLLESMPASSRPRALGGGLWELSVPDEDRRLLLRQQASSIDFAFDTPGLDHAAGLRADVGAGRRIRARAWDLPVDDFNLGDVLGSSASQELGRNLDEVVRGLREVSVEIDFGTTRDLELVGVIDAPFHRLGLGTLGEPRLAPSNLESHLPADPDVVISVSLGDLAPLGRMLSDSLPLDEIPDPFGAMAKDALSYTTALLDQLGNEAVAALYFSRKGEAALLLAAAVQDDQEARAAVRGLQGTIHRALEAQRKLVGQNDGAKFEVGWKTDGLSVAGGKADHLWVTVPRDLRDEITPASMFLARGRLEAFFAVRDRVAVATFGAGARAPMTSFLRGTKKPLKPSLADDPALARIRAATGGCQLCASMDSVEFLRMRLAVLRAKTKDRTALREIRKADASLAKMRMDSGTSFGARVEDERAGVAFVIPKTLLFAPIPTFRRLVEINDLIDRDGQAPQESAR
jgi:hypothetical protein